MQILSQILNFKCLPLNLFLTGGLYCCGVLNSSLLHPAAAISQMTNNVDYLSHDKHKVVVFAK